MTRHPFGRWNREQPHVLEIVYSGGGCWAQCSCQWQGDPRTTTEQADADAIAHERFVFEARRQGKRLVRGRVE